MAIAAWNQLFPEHQEWKQERWRKSARLIDELDKVRPYSVWAYFFPIKQGPVLYPEVAEAKLAPFILQFSTFRIDIPVNPDSYSLHLPLKIPL